MWKQAFSGPQTECHLLNCRLYSKPEFPASDRGPAPASGFNGPGAVLTLVSSPAAWNRHRPLATTAVLATGVYYLQWRIYGSLDSDSWTGLTVSTVYFVLEITALLAFFFQLQFANRAHTSKQAQYETVEKQLSIALAVEMKSGSCSDLRATLQAYCQEISGHDKEIWIFDDRFRSEIQSICSDFQARYAPSENAYAELRVKLRSDYLLVLKAGQLILPQFKTAAREALEHHAKLAAWQLTSAESLQHRPETALWHNDAGAQFWHAKVTEPAFKHHLSSCSEDYGLLWRCAALREIPECEFLSMKGTHLFPLLKHRWACRSSASALLVQLPPQSLTDSIDRQKKRWLRQRMLHRHMEAPDLLQRWGLLLAAKCESIWTWRWIGLISGPALYFGLDLLPIRSTFWDWLAHAAPLYGTGAFLGHVSGLKPRIFLRLALERFLFCWMSLSWNFQAKPAIENTAQLGRPRASFAILSPVFSALLALIAVRILLSNPLPQTPYHVFYCIWLLGILFCICQVLRFFLPARDQRRWLRLPVRLPIKVAWRTDGHSFSAIGEVLDLSEGGAAIRLTRPLPSATALEAELDSNLVLQSHSLRNGWQRRGEYLAVLQFLTPSSQEREQIFALMLKHFRQAAEPLTPSSLLDSLRRLLYWTGQAEEADRAYRFRYRRPGLLEAGRTKVPVTLLDLSQTGASLTLGRDHFRNTNQVTLNLPLVSGSILRLPAQVVRRKNQGCKLALQFAPLPPAVRESLSAELHTHSFPGTIHEAIAPPPSRPLRSSTIS